MRVAPPLPHALVSRMRLGISPSLDLVYFPGFYRDWEGNFRPTRQSPNIHASPFTSGVFAGLLPAHLGKSPLKAIPSPSNSHMRGASHIVRGERSSCVSRTAMAQTGGDRAYTNNGHLLRLRLTLLSDESFSHLVPYPPLPIGFLDQEFFTAAGSEAPAFIPRCVSWGREWGPHCLVHRSSRRCSRSPMRHRMAIHRSLLPARRTAAPPSCVTGPAPNTIE